MAQRGRLILVPAGSGKNKWIKKLSDQDKLYWLDGHALLAEKGLITRHDIWYRDQYISYRRRITKLFDTYLNNGYNILFSGNPRYLEADLLIFPQTHMRYFNLKTTLGNFSNSLFKKELSEYREAIYRVPTIYGDIPRPEILSITLTYL